MKKLQTELTFIGRPFADHLMNEQKSFTECNQELENDAGFQQFLTANHLEKQRGSLVVFGPENFMYWYGVIAPSVVETPAGLMKFVLPEGQVAQEELANQSLAFFAQPLNVVIPEFLQKISAAGITTYENLGDSMTPYVLQTLDTTTQTLTQRLYLEG
ncbi:hypothetical protein OZX56_06290 [Lactobacillus sp. ESL0684]|uniref:hypothetical protein n=1 Tax=Lactobacillus sp. ESL0684 TaxID=2983213 RepID=UPI0023F6923A|nr:hypothetical protein [Lactobacillus sp. ESL0684]WEV43153.1 hypothetical protein OZX56_06290 [Lactobacillus sp. ESL0684]